VNNTKENGKSPWCSDRSVPMGRREYVESSLGLQSILGAANIIAVGRQ